MARHAGLAILLLSLPTVSLAGNGLLETAPTLGETGLIALGVALAGVGVAGLLGREKR